MKKIHLKYLLYLIAPLPGIWLFLRALTGRLGADPIDHLIASYGEWALWLMIITLSMTPLKRLGVNWIYFRRPLGLIAFFYMLCHAIIWIVLDQGGDWERITREIFKRPFITLGVIALLIGFFLALTSNNYSIRKMGRNWRKLHMLIYPLIGIILIHNMMVVKIIGYDLYAYIFLSIALLLTRIFPIKR